MLDEQTSLNIKMNTKSLEDNRTSEQKEQLKTFTQAGKMLELAIARGAKSHLRPEMTDKQYKKYKSRKQMAKASRKANR